ncbi:hypothetical protein AAG570_001648 [Ranatra chinensis]|uniref:Uncharacterized protein n=1 Tax=Ranatra chinensis TaxID=642074 RepID=A0ABD0YVP7_9HEMI
MASKGRNMLEKNTKQEMTEIGSIYSRVRKRIFKLMGTEVARVTDREFMVKLKDRIQELHKEKVIDRINKRQEWEKDRETRLILERKLPMSTRPGSVLCHPFFRSLFRLQAYKKAKQAEVDSKKPKRRVPRFDYSIFDTEENLETGDWSQMSIDLEGLTARMDVVEAERNFCYDMTAQDLELEYLYTPEEYEKLIYEAPLIKELRRVTVTGRIVH